MAFNYSLSIYLYLINFLLGGGGVDSLDRGFIKFENRDILINLNGRSKVTKLYLKIIGSIEFRSLFKERVSTTNKRTSRGFEAKRIYL